MNRYVSAPEGKPVWSSHGGRQDREAGSGKESDSVLKLKNLKSKFMRE
jgi:hypothetical protein